MLDILFDEENDVSFEQTRNEVVSQFIEYSSNTHSVIILHGSKCFISTYIHWLNKYGFSLYKWDPVWEKGSYRLFKSIERCRF